MDEEMRHARVLWVLFVKLLQYGRRFKLIRMGHISFRRGSLQGESIKHPCLVIVGVALRHLLHRRVIGAQSHVDRNLVVVAEISAQCLDPIALALGLCPDRARLVECFPGSLGVGPRRRPNQGVAKQVDRNSPVSQSAAGIFLQNALERPAGIATFQRKNSRSKSLI